MNRNAPIRASLLATLFVATAAAKALAAPCPVCPEPSFGPAARAFSTRPPGLPGNGTAEFVAVGDFNNDGIPDLAVDGGTLLIYLGTGSGAFRPPVSYPYSDPRAIAIGDFDGDGNLDLVLSGFKVLLGDGTGGFTARDQPPVTGLVGTEYLVTGDFDGDGIVDIAAANYYGNEVSILRGLGDGTFAFAQNLTVGSAGGGFQHLSLAAADLDSDGITDLVIQNTGDGTLGVVLGRPGGGWTVSLPPAPGVIGGDIGIGDFNGDGHPDLVVQSATSLYVPKTLTVLLGNGDGTFHLGASVSAGYNFHFVVGDFTGDGKLDIAMNKQVDPDFTYGLFVLPGTGTGDFGTPINTLVPQGNFPPMIAAADLDQDGRLDLIAPGWASDAFFVLLGRGGGRFEEAPRYSAGVAGIQGIALGDVDNDGIPDIVATGFDRQELAVMRGDGMGGFRAPIVMSVPNGVFGPPVLADFNHDGKLDVAVTGGNSGGTVLLGGGDGTFGSPSTIPSNQAPMAAADFDRDGKPDLLIASGTLFLIRGNGDGTFQAPVVIADPLPNAFAVGDLNGDGKPDIAISTGVYVSGWSYSVSVLLGNGDGTFSAPISTGIGDRADAMTIADLNGDGKMDVVLVYRGAVAVLLGDGAGSFGAPILAETDGFYRRVLVADLNGDGIADVVLDGQDNIAVLAGTGGGHLARPRLYTLPGDPISAAIADVDGDGKPDIAVGCIGTVYTPPDFIALLRNTSCEARHLVIETGVATCTPPATPLSVQPAVRVVDDADNLVSCAAGDVSAHLVPGTGTPGALLGGTATVPLTNGRAAFSNLSVDRAGTGYVIALAGPAGIETRTRAFTVGAGAAVSISGPSVLCAPGSFQATAGFDTYVWRVDGAFVGTRSSVTLDGRAVGVGHHVLSVAATKSGCSSTSSIAFDVTQPDVTITAPAAVCWFGSDQSASVPDAGSGASYAWTIVNGRLVSGATTNAVQFHPGREGSVVLSVRVTNAAGCSDTNARTISIDAGVCGPADNVFPDSDWTLTQFTAGGGGNVTASQQTGPSGPYRAVTHSLNAGPGAVLGVHIYNPFVFDPTALGALGYLEYGEMGFCASGCTDTPQITGAAVRQGGKLYISIPQFNLVNYPNPVPIQLPFINQYDFGLVSVTNTSLLDDTQHPDFTFGAAPLQFGFFRASFGAAAPYVQTAGIDDWQIRLHSGAIQFTDLTFGYWARRYIEAIFDAGVSAGCTFNAFCPESPATRAQMSVFLLRGKQGASYHPPPATGTVFGDVPAGSFAAAWIEEIARRGVTAGCSASPPLFCPADPITRGQMAVFLLRALLGPTYTPPPAAGIFVDLPASNGLAPWAEDLRSRGIAAGCTTAPLAFCPAAPVTRAQMAVFITVTFGLPIPP